MEQIRDVIACTLAAVAAYFAPVQSIFMSVLWIFALNFTFGLLTGIIRHDEHFSFRKAWACVAQSTVIFVLLASIYFIGDKIGNAAGAMQCVSVVVYALCYFYGVNIAKNLTELFPSNKLFAFVYYLISVEFIKKVPFLEKFTDDGKVL